MCAKTFDRFSQAIIVLPYLCGFAAAAALDRIIDIQNLFLPAVVGAAVVSASLVIRRTTGP